MSVMHNCWAGMRYHNMSTKPIKVQAIQIKNEGQRSFGVVPQCVSCFKDATKQALFELENTIAIQNYCDNCVSKAEY